MPQLPLAPLASQKQRPWNAPGLSREDRYGSKEAEHSLGLQYFFCSLLRLHQTVWAAGAALPPLGRGRWGESWNQRVGRVVQGTNHEEPGKKPARWGRGQSDFPDGTCRIWGDDNWFLILFCFLIMYQNWEEENGSQWKREYEHPSKVSKNKAVQWLESFYVKWHRLRTTVKAWVVVRRDRIVVSTLRCGRSNLGSNRSHGIRLHLASPCFFLFLNPVMVYIGFSETWPPILSKKEIIKVCDHRTKCTNH